MAEADQLREWALAAPVTPAPAASVDQLARHLDFMAAALPSRGNDAETGKKRAAVYASLLAGQSNEALAFMARKACATLEWFPTPAQCLAILAEYRPRQSEQATALLTCDRFTKRTFDTWLDALARGGAIGDVPDQWKRIAVERGALRRLDGGVFVSRALYHGPARNLLANRVTP